MKENFHMKFNKEQKFYVVHYWHENIIITFILIPKKRFYYIEYNVVDNISDISIVSRICKTLLNQRCSHILFIKL